MGIKKPFTAPIGVDLDNTYNGTTLNFGSTAQRITGDMSTATIANRLFFQTNVSNGNTSISVMPNGTSGVSAVSCYNNSDPTNASFVGFVTTTNTHRIQSSVSGNGTYLPLTFFINAAEAARFDTSGNLGLGVTPSAWGSTQKAIQFGVASFAATGSAGGPKLFCNTYVDASGNSVYYANGFASQIFQPISDGSIRFYVAPTGTAGNTISFTQAMTLSTLGRLGVGTTNPIGFVTVSNAGAEGLEFFPNGGAGGGPYLNSYNRSNSSYIQFTTYASAHTWYSGASAGTRAVDLDTDGNLLINTTSTGAAGLGISNVKNLTFAEGSGTSYANLFRQTSSAATILANGYKWSSTSNGFASSVGSSWAKSAIALNNGEAIFYADAAATVANGTDATPTERLRIKSTGQTRFQPLASDPSNAENGDVYYNSATNKLRVYAGGAWTDLH